jgi:hypothetical protein
MKLLRMGTCTHRPHHTSIAHLTERPAPAPPFIPPATWSDVVAGAAVGATHAGALAAGTVVVPLSVVPALLGTQRARRALSTALSVRLGERVDVEELDLQWVRGSQHVRPQPPVSPLTLSPSYGPPPPGSCSGALAALGSFTGAAGARGPVGSHVASITQKVPLWQMQSEQLLRVRNSKHRRARFCAAAKQRPHA